MLQTPPCLILQMPRFGRVYKMFDRIIPSPYIDITDILEKSKCSNCVWFLTRMEVKSRQLKCDAYEEELSLCQIEMVFVSDGKKSCQMELKLVWDWNETHVRWIWDSCSMEFWLMSHGNVTHVGWKWDSCQKCDSCQQDGNETCQISIRTIEEDRTNGNLRDFLLLPHSVPFMFSFLLTFLIWATWIGVCHFDTSPMSSLSQGRRHAHYASLKIRLIGLSARIAESNSRNATKCVTFASARWVCRIMSLTPSDKWRHQSDIWRYFHPIDDVIDWIDGVNCIR